VDLTLRKIDWPKHEKQEKPTAARKKRKNRLSANGLMLTKIIVPYGFYRAPTVPSDRDYPMATAQPFAPFRSCGLVRGIFATAEPA
jgi:hypothetical protein